MSLFDVPYEKLQELATEASRWFTVQERTPSGEKYWTLKDGHPEWIKDEIVYPAHDRMMPDDHKYEFVHDALEAIANHDSEDAAADSVSEDVDVYNHDLIRWVGSALVRAGYVDEVLEESEHKEFFTLLQAAQIKEREEVFAAVLSASKEYAEGLEGDEEEDDEDESEETSE